MQQITKFKAFIDALEKLCIEHKVELFTSGYDGIQVWDLEDGEQPSHEFEDKMKEGKQ